MSTHDRITLVMEDVTQALRGGLSATEALARIQSEAVPLLFIQAVESCLLRRALVLFGLVVRRDCPVTFLLEALQEAAGEDARTHDVMRSLLAPGLPLLPCGHPLPGDGPAAPADRKKEM